MNCKHLLGYLFLGLLIMGCKNEDIGPAISMPLEIQPFYGDFLEEASSHGVKLEVKNLLIKYESLPPSGGIAQCGLSSGIFNGETKNIIRIDTTCTAWKHSRLAREVVLFHELGHVLLLRQHDNTQLSNKDWKSMMYGGNWFVTEYYIEKPERRSYYLNELFNSDTPAPEWSQ